MHMPPNCLLAYRCCCGRRKLSAISVVTYYGPSKLSLIFCIWISWSSFGSSTFGQISVALIFFVCLVRKFCRHTKHTSRCQYLSASFYTLSLSLSFPSLSLSLSLFSFSLSLSVSIFHSISLWTTPLVELLLLCRQVLVRNYTIPGSQQWYLHALVLQRAACLRWEC